MSLRKLKQDLLRSIGNFIIYRLAIIVCKTLKIRIQNGELIEKFYNEHRNFVLAFWHGTMLVPWFVHRDKNFAAIVSKSKDGKLLERVLKPMNYTIVRGSSHTGGSVALGILVDYAKNEKSIAITPDGPKGPARKLKAGAVITAKRANIPLILLGVGYRNKVELSSWDKFQVPKLFSKVNLIYSEPVYIDKDLSYNDTSRVILECERKLNILQKEAETFL
jgi:lysophospholipid acyltransferase (LPLAT)-like uncharacterized protein